MRVQTEEWRRFIPGIRMYKGKLTYFYNGEKLWDEENGEYLIYNRRERSGWEVIMVLPGVEVIPMGTFYGCYNVKTVIMSDTVRWIEDEVFYGCFSLKFVRLSTNLEYIGEKAFFRCASLASIFIPESCREIGDFAFSECKKLIILSVPRHTQLSTRGIITRSQLIDKSPFEFEFSNEFEDFVRNIYYKEDSSFLKLFWRKTASDLELNEWILEVNEWIKSINEQEEYALHRECASYEPSLENIVEIIKHEGLLSLNFENKIGVTPSKYLTENPFHEIDEQKIINAYILDLMGETLNDYSKGSSKAENDDILEEGPSTFLETAKAYRIMVQSSLDEQMKRQARWKSNYMFLRIKNDNSRIVKVIKTSLDEEKTLEEILKGCAENPYLLRIDGEVFEWDEIKTVQVFDLPTLCGGEKKKFTLHFT